MTEAIQQRSQKAISDKTFPGCVIGIVRANGERHVFPFGKFTYEQNSTDVREDTIYDLASVTKSIPVASLAALFVAEGKFTLADAVKTYIPELQNDFGTTIEDLLRYRVHGPQMASLQYETFEQIRTHVLEHGFDGPPNQSEYTNLPAFLLGIVLERVCGEILPALAHKYFFGSLAMNDTTFFPHDTERVAPTEIVDDKDVQGLVHDESARLFAQKRRAVGHAGLFSTAPDILNFLEALLQEKFAAVVDAAQQGLGWQLEGDFLGRQTKMKQGESLLSGSGKRFGKTGFTGTSVVLDTEKSVGLVILSNRTYPHRPADMSAISAFRSAIADLVFGTD